jgi:hypothetical protein
MPSPSTSTASERIRSRLIGDTLLDTDRRGLYTLRRDVEQLLKDYDEVRRVAISLRQALINQAMAMD